MLSPDCEISRQSEENKNSWGSYQPKVFQSLDWSRNEEMFDRKTRVSCNVLAKISQILGKVEPSYLFMVFQDWKV